MSRPRETVTYYSASSVPVCPDCYADEAEVASCTHRWGLTDDPGAWTCDRCDAPRSMCDCTEEVPW